jgi:hypothetical protein
MVDIIENHGHVCEFEMMNNEPVRAIVTALNKRKYVLEMKLMVSEVIDTGMLSPNGTPELKFVMGMAVSVKEHSKKEACDGNHR